MSDRVIVKKDPNRWHNLYEPFWRISMEIFLFPAWVICKWMERNDAKEGRERGHGPYQSGIGCAFIILISLPFFPVTFLLALPFLLLDGLFGLYKSVFHVDITWIERLVNHLCGFSRGIDEY